MDNHVEAPEDLNEEIWDALTESISDVTRVDRDALKFSTRFREDIEINSMDMVEVMANIEDSLEIYFDDLEFRKIHTVGDVYSMLADKVKGDRLPTGDGSRNMLTPPGKDENR